MKIDSISPLPPQQWKANLAAFALPWWLFVAPTFARWIWPQLTSGALPAPVELLLGLSWLWLVLGLAIAMGALSSDYKSHTAMQRAARWFVAGFFSLPIVACLLASA